MNKIDLIIDALESAHHTNDTSIMGLTKLRHTVALDAARELRDMKPVAWELRQGKTDRVLLQITNDAELAHKWKCSLEEVVPLYALGESNE
jgi:hypothetical protein